MKTCVFRLTSGLWGVNYRNSSGEWVLYCKSCISKEEAITQARMAAYCIPFGRLYGKIPPISRKGRQLMRFKDFLSIAGEVYISATVAAFGMRFTTTHYTRYYKEMAADELMAMHVSAVRSANGVLELDLTPDMA